MFFEFSSGVINRHAAVQLCQCHSGCLIGLGIDEVINTDAHSPGGCVNKKAFAIVGCSGYVVSADGVVHTVALMLGVVGLLCNYCKRRNWTACEICC